MIPLDPYKDKTLAILGLGRTGRSVAQALVGAGAHVTVWDDGESGRKAAEADGLAVVDPKEWPWTSLDALVMSPGIPHKHPVPHPVAAEALRNQVPIIGDLALLGDYVAEVGACLMVVTGTNGKSTTTALIGHVAEKLSDKVAIGGNIGTGVLSLPALGEGGLYIVEASSYQLDLAPDLDPEVAVLMNISPDHLDRHGGMNGYVAAKRAVFETLAEQATAVVSLDDPYSAELVHDLRGAGKTVCTTSLYRNADVSVFGGKIHDDGAAVLDLSDLSLSSGPHNAQNVAVAFAALRALGFEASAIAEAMKDFAGLRHRMETIGRLENVEFINDSKATNAEAAAPALASREGIYWIAGGVAKAGGIGSLEPYFRNVCKVYLIGKAAEEFSETLSGKVEWVIEGTLDKAVRHATEDALKDQASTCVLLSPACASFDQFDSFEARGDAFRGEVSSLPGVQVMREAS